MRILFRFINCMDKKNMTISANKRVGVYRNQSKNGVFPILKAGRKFNPKVEGPRTGVKPLDVVDSLGLPKIKPKKFPNFFKGNSKSDSRRNRRTLLLSSSSEGSQVHFFYGRKLTDLNYKRRFFLIRNFYYRRTLRTYISAFFSPRSKNSFDTQPRISAQELDPIFGQMFSSKRVFIMKRNWWFTDWAKKIKRNVSSQFKRIFFRKQKSLRVIWGWKARRFARYRKRILRRNLVKNFICYLQVSLRKNNVFYTVRDFRGKTCYSASNGTTVYKGSRRLSVAACEAVASKLTSILRLNKLKHLVTFFRSYPNWLVRPFLKRVFMSARKFGCIYYLAVPHGAKPRDRTSRRV